MRRALLAVIVAWVALAVNQTAAWAESPLGHWLNEGHTGRVEVTEQDGELTGVITWVKERNEDGSLLLDTKNPDPALRNRPVEGIVLMEGLRPARRANTWDGGTIYDPDSGKTYRCTLRVESTDRLLLRGFIGVSLIGKTTQWERVEPEQLEIAADTATAPANPVAR